MQLVCWALLPCLACGLQNIANHPLRTAAPRAHCTTRAVADREIVCTNGRTPLRALGLSSPLRAAVERASGGLWLLDAEGRLARIDRDGQLTLRSATTFVSLVGPGDVLCGLELDGVVRCVADHHEDLLCEQTPELETSAWALDFRAFAPAEGERLCGVDLQGRQRCYRLIRQCERACLRFPSCESPPRCADPCRPDERPIELLHPGAPEGPAHFVHQLGTLG